MVIQVAMLQGKELPSNRDYLDNYSTITAFKTVKYIRNIKTKKKECRWTATLGAQKQTEKGSTDELKHGTCQRA